MVDHCYNVLVQILAPPLDVVLQNMLQFGLSWIVVYYVSQGPAMHNVRRLKGHKSDNNRMIPLSNVFCLYMLRLNCRAQDRVVSEGPS